MVAPTNIEAFKRRDTIFAAGDIIGKLEIDYFWSKVSLLFYKSQALRPVCIEVELGQIFIQIEDQLLTLLILKVRKSRLNVFLSEIFVCHK